MTIYRGEQTYIRPITYDDTGYIVKWRNQEEIKSRFFFREPFTREMHENWMRTKVYTGEVVQFIVCMNDSDIPVGSTYFRDIDEKMGVAEYGVFIGEADARGHGIGKEILFLTLQYGWEQLGLNRVRARAISTNEASIQSFLHSGFTRDELVRSVLCSDGSYVDMIFMSICKNAIS